MSEVALSFSLTEAEAPTYQLIAREAERLRALGLSLNRIAESAPSDEATAAVNVVAENLRGLSFAQEAADLLRSGPMSPTGDQLALADQTSRTQLTQLDAAIAGLRAQVEPAEESPPAS